MRTPTTARKCAYKTFYVFFAFGGKYSGKYAKIGASSLEKAKHYALIDYGVGNVCGIYADSEYAQAKIKAFNLQQI